MRVREYRVNGLHIRVSRVSRSSREWIGVAKRDPFSLRGIRVAREPGQLWVTFGRDAGEVVARLLRKAEQGECA